MENKLQRLENEVDEMQDSFEVSALKDRVSMYQGDIKRLESKIELFKSEVDERIRVAVAHIKNAKNEIGVPSKDYPANITNAVDFLNIAIAALEVE